MELLRRIGAIRGSHATFASPCSGHGRSGPRSDACGVRSRPTVPRCGDRGARRAQHAVVTRRQLRETGLNDTSVTRGVAAGRLHRVHHGVYAVGHAVLGPRGRWTAAVLAGGPGAALSHSSAAALWEMRPSGSAWVDVTVRRSGRARRPRLRIHRPRMLPPDEVTTRHGIPVTTPARTILDLAATLQPARLEHLLDQAEIRELTDYPTLDAIARAHPGHRGARKLRAALHRHHAGSNLTNSDLEIASRSSAARAASRSRASTSASRARPSTSSSKRSASSSRRTAGAITGPAAHSRTTAPATRSSQEPAIAPLRFTDTHIAHDPAGVAEAIGSALAQTTRNAA
jgi:hypothetical protein